MLDCYSEIPFLDLELGLADDVELDRLNAHSLCVAPRGIILCRIPLDDSDLTLPRRFQVVQKIVDIPLEQRGLGRELLRCIQFYGDDIVQAFDDLFGFRRQGVGASRREVKPPSDVASQQVDHDQYCYQEPHSQSQPPQCSPCRSKLAPDQGAEGKRQKDGRQGNEVDDIAEVDDTPTDAVEVRQHA